MSTTRRTPRHIVLVGPIGVGKTPVAEVIADKLDVEHVVLDLQDDDLAFLGWKQEVEAQAISSGVEAQLRYRRQFAAPLIQRLVERHQRAVLDCGGNDLVGVTEVDRRNIRRSMQQLGLNHIAAILPFESAEETASHLDLPPVVVPVLMRELDSYSTCRSVPA